MRNKKVEIELQVTLRDGEVIGCVMYYLPTGDNLVAMCYIRQALIRGHFDFCNGIIIISYGENQFPFVGDHKHLEQLCKLMKTGSANNFRQLQYLQDGREIMVIGQGKAKEEIPKVKKGNNVVDLSLSKQFNFKKGLRIGVAKGYYFS